MGEAFSWKCLTERYLHPVIWKTPLKSEALFTPGGIPHTRMSSIRVVSVVVQGTFAAERGKPHPCRAAQRSARSEERAVWGGWQPRLSWSPSVGKMFRATPSPALWARTEEASDVSGARVRNEHPQRMAKTRAQPSCLQLVPLLASQKPKSQFA